MPIDDLASVIETLQQRIRRHGPSLRENEIRTRMALIDPLLPALGWDVSDPALATPEYAVGNARVDYALLGADGKPAALLEAKRLGESLDSHRMQMVNYANMSGIPYAGLTDGDHWELYEVFAQKPIEERRLLEVSIAASPAHQSALRLLLLWRPNLASGQPTAVSAPILRPATSEPEPMPDAPTAPTSLPPGWIALSSFSRSDTTKAPSAIRFSDGAEHPVQYWRHLIERTAAWLWARGLLTRSNLPVPVPGGSRYVANTEPVHKSGKEFIAPQHIDGAPVIVEGNVGGGQAISYTAKLLQHCGANPADVFVQTGP